MYAELIILGDAPQDFGITRPFEHSRRALGPSELRLDGDANRLTFFQRQRMGRLVHDIVVPQAAMSQRFVPRDSRDAVEIRIGAGKVGKSVDTHRCNDQRIIMQKPGLLTCFGGEIRQGRVDRENSHGEQGNLLNGVTESRQRLHLGRMIPKPHGDAGARPAERLHGFDRHQPMSHLTEDVRGYDAEDFLVFDTLEEFGGGWTIQGIRLEVVDEYAGVQKDRPAGGQVGI
jgi:hypothetical protein